MSDEFKPDGPSRLATGADFVAAMTQANEFLIERDRRIAELEAAIRRYVVACDRDILPCGCTEVAEAFGGLRAAIKQ